MAPLDEVQRTELLMILQQAIGEMGSEIERAIGEGLMAALRAQEKGANPLQSVSIKAPTPAEFGVLQSDAVTVSVIAPCGCSMPMQVSITASWDGPTPLDDPDVQAAVGDAVMSDGSLRVEFEQVGSPIPCSEHRPPPTPAPCPSVQRIFRLLTGIPALLDRLGEDGAGNKVNDAIAELVPGRALINVTALDAARDIARVADHHDHLTMVDAETTVPMNLADLRALRAALPKEEG